MEIAEVAIAKELIHVDCGLEVAKCQAREGRTAEGLFALWFNDRRYATGYAGADDIFGPYVKAEDPLLATDLAAGIVGPGGQDVVTGPHDETWILFHGWASEGYRRLYLAPLNWQNHMPTLEMNGREPLPMP